ncbi:MAG: hypothetical protein NTX85_04180 [Candidatus Nomurabacteria bacterium]|nr:hypothetical protein [Candidatus Nomurabacteria bacterium]
MESFKFSSGDNAKKDNEAWDKKVLEENNKKQSDIEKARKVKFDDIKIGDTAMYKGEIYSVSEKNSDALTLNISSKNEENPSFEYGVTVSVDDISDYYTPNKN